MRVFVTPAPAEGAIGEPCEICDAVVEDVAVIAWGKDRPLTMPVCPNGHHLMPKGWSDPDWITVVE